MKRLFCLVLAVVLCIGVSLAEGSPFAKKGISLPGKPGLKGPEPKAESVFLAPEATEEPEVAEAEPVLPDNGGSLFAKKGISLPGKPGLKDPEPKAESVFLAPEATEEPEVAEDEPMLPDNGGSPFAKKGISLPGKPGLKAPEPKAESVFWSSEVDYQEVKKLGPTVPDPKGVFDVDGALYLENVEDSGTTYDIYTYYFYMDMEQIADAVIDYGMYLADNYGFQIQKYNMDYALAYYGFFHDSCNMPVELGLYIEEEGELASGGQGLFQALLSVPDNFDFVPGSYPSDMGKCIDCGGSGRCPHCVGGRSNYGAGYEDCVICDGTNICNICDGTGET